VRIHCVVRIPCPYEQVYQALKVECCSIPTERGTVEVSIEDGVLTLELTSGDASSLRASLNTWLRLAGEAIEVAHITSVGEHI